MKADDSSVGQSGDEVIKSELLHRIRDLNACVEKLKQQNDVLRKKLEKEQEAREEAIKNEQIHRTRIIQNAKDEVNRELSHCRSHSPVHVDSVLTTPPRSRLEVNPQIRLNLAQRRQNRFFQTPHSLADKEVNELAVIKFTASLLIVVLQMPLFDVSSPATNHGTPNTYKY